MLALDHAVTLGVIRCSEGMGDPKQTAKLQPKTGSELASTVRHYGGRDAKTGHPMTKKSVGTGMSCD